MNQYMLNEFHKQLIGLAYDNKALEVTDVLLGYNNISDNRIVNTPNIDGKTLLMKFLELEPVLKEKNIDHYQMIPNDVIRFMDRVNHRDNKFGRSALSISIDIQSKIHSLLIISKLSSDDLETSDHNGNTDLMLALQNDSVMIALEIAQKSKHLGQQNNAGKTVLSFANDALRRVERAREDNAHKKVLELREIISQIKEKSGDVKQDFMKEFGRILGTRKPKGEKAPRTTGAKIIAFKPRNQINKN